MFGNVIFGISKISFDNTMQWMDKMRIQFGCNVEIYIVDKLNFPREKKLLSIFRMIHNFTIAINEIHFTICEVKINNSNAGYCSYFFFTYLFPIGVMAWWLGHWIPNLGV